MPRPGPPSSILACLLAVAASLLLPAHAGALPWTGPASGSNGADDYVDGLTGSSPALRLVVSSPSVEVSEAGTVGNVTVRLASAPDRQVAVTMLADIPAASADRQVRAASAATLEFGPQTWNEPRVVSITAIDDEIVEATPHTAHVTLAVVGGDTSQLASTVVDVRIVDNDTPRVLVQPSDGANRTAEGGESDSMELRLATRPAADVTVSFELGGQVVTSAPSVTFTPRDWNALQPVRIGAVQDRDVEGEHSEALRFSIRSDDPAYAGGAAVPDAQLVTVLDDDRPALLVTPSGADTRVAENGRGDEYALQLASRPTSTVRIAVEGSGDIELSPRTLEFAPDAWSTPQQVTVTAIDDDEDEKRVETAPIRHVVDGDRFWRGVPAPGLPVAVIDDEHEVAAGGDEGAGAGGDEAAGGDDAGAGSGGTSLDDSGLPAGDGVGAGAAAANAARAARDATRAVGGSAPALPKLASGRPVATGSAPAGSTSAGEPQELDADRTAARAERDGDQDRAEGTWYARNWKKTLPATAAGALGLGGVLFALMSDPSQVARRRLW